MVYRNFRDLKISALGLGCMRFPLKSDDKTDIDQDAVQEMFDYAMANGINYYDTAWPYHGGASEICVGKALSKYPRDSYYLATKFPGFDESAMKNVPGIFEKQLEKCAVDYFDFYLCHNVAEKNIDWFLSEEYGVMDYLLSQKRNGRIRHLGFSTHGSLKTMQRFLDAYGHELEFCQIQLNYLDWDLQNAKAKVDLIRSYGLAVWVMEPVRGGRLAVLPEEHMAVLRSMRPWETAPGWAFRFLQGIDGVGVVLSGMSNMEQLRENIKTFAQLQPLNPDEQAALHNIAEDMIRKNAVPCTGCNYCTEYCPQSLPIPSIMKLYNEKSADVPIPGPKDCIGCRSCERVCPQGIMISEIMEKYASTL